MWRKGLIAAGLVAWFGGVGALQDAGSVVSNVSRAIGATGLKTIQYSGTGFVYNFGQNYRPDIPDPKFHATYSRAVDYEKGVSREETVRTQFENPPRGGGGQPLYREARAAAVVTESSAWGGGALALTPHGWVNAAMTAQPALTISSTRVAGKPMTVVSFTSRGKYKVNGYINEQNLLERVETWTGNPILGDMLIETTYADYRTSPFGTRSTAITIPTTRPVSARLWPKGPQSSRTR